MTHCMQDQSLPQDHCRKRALMYIQTDFMSLRQGPCWVSFSVHLPHLACWPFAPPCFSGRGRYRVSPTSATRCLLGKLQRAAPGVVYLWVQVDCPAFNDAGLLHFAIDPVRTRVRVVDLIWSPPSIARSSLHYNMIKCRVRSPAQRW